VLSRGFLLVALALGMAGCAAAVGISDLGRDAQVFVVSTDGHRLVRITDDDAHHSSLSWSPSGNRLAFVSSRGGVGTLETVSPTGHGRRALRTQPFLASVSWSPDGKLFAFASLVDETRTRIGVIRADGSGTRVISTFVQPRGTPLAPTWSPDGTSVAYGRAFGTGPARIAPGQPPGGPAVLPGTLKIVVSGIGGGGERPVAAGKGDEWDPRWSPDGGTIMFRRGPALLLASTRRANVSRLAGDFLDAQPQWSPDGRKVALVGVTFAGDRRYHLWVIDARSRRRTTLANDVASVRPSWSPDGGRIAFADRDRLAVVSVRDGATSTLRRIPDAEIGEIAWSPDGRRLAFTVRKVPED
jgi:Tol biopolymer transport system component